MHTMVSSCGSHGADNTGILMWQNGGSMGREWGGMRRDEDGGRREDTKLSSIEFS